MEQTAVRERVAIIFMTLSAVATVLVGIAVVHELNKKDTTTSALTANANQPTSGDAAGGATDTTVAGDTTAAGAGATSGGTGAGTGATSGGGTAATPKLSTGNAGVSSGGLITVGGVYDETGPFDATVERDTVRAYFNKVNAAGGVNGHKFQLVDCDSAFDPSRAHQCVQKLQSQGILAMVGWLSVSGEQPETTYLNQQGVPVIGGLGVPTEFSVPLSWPVSANLTAVGTALGTHAAVDLGFKKPAIIVINANFIKPVEATLLDTLHKHGVTEQKLYEADATKADYTDFVVQMQTGKADSIIAALDPFSYARLFQAMDRQNFHPKFFGSGLDKKSAARQYGKAVYGASSLTPFLEPDDHQSNAEIQEYQSAVKTYFPNQVDALDVYTVGTWIGAKLFVQAVRNIGTGPVNRQTLANALNAIKNYDSRLTVPLSYSAASFHDPNRCFQWIANQNGTWATQSDWKCF
jgi:branched-chain amino acid transport system substrate-binding protein